MDLILRLLMVEELRLIKITNTIEALEKEFKNGKTGH